jgi:hypothetical protein
MRQIVSLLLLSVLALLVGCAASEKPAVLPFDDNNVGCRIVKGEVIFRFDSSLYTYITRNDNGKWLKIDEVTIDNVSVAGDFNDWSRDAWQMSQAADGVYELRVDLRKFAKRNEWAFKFVVNGFFWVEPPEEALNKVPSGYWGANRSYNLVLRIQ